MADRPDNRPAQVLHEADLREKELKKKLAEFQPEAVDPNEDEAARLVRLEKRRASLPEDIAKKYEVEDKWVEEVRKEQFSAAGMKSKEDAWVESVDASLRETKNSKHPSSKRPIHGPNLADGSKDAPAARQRVVSDVRDLLQAQHEAAKKQEPWSKDDDAKFSGRKGTSEDTAAAAMPEAKATTAAATAEPAKSAGEATWKEFEAMGEREITAADVADVKRRAMRERNPKLSDAQIEELNEEHDRKEEAMIAEEMAEEEWVERMMSQSKVKHESKHEDTKKSGRPAVSEAVREADRLAFRKFEEAEEKLMDEERREHQRAKTEEQWVNEIVAGQTVTSESKMKEIVQERHEGWEADEKWNMAMQISACALRREPNNPNERGLIAKRDVAAGEVVLRTNMFAAVVSDECSKSHCHHCLQPSEALKRCSACGFAKYCCVAHQREAWAYHKNECKMIKHTNKPSPKPAAASKAASTSFRPIQPEAPMEDDDEGMDGATAAAAASTTKEKERVPGQTIRLLARVLERVNEPSHPATWATGIEGVKALNGYLDSLSSSRAAELKTQSSMLCGLLSEVKPNITPPSVDLVTSLLSIISMNAHTITDEELQPIGIGLYPLAALTNHDCAPTCVQTFEEGGSQIVLRALRPITESEPITIGYVELLASRLVRRNDLESGYHFMCMCDRCEREQGVEGRKLSGIAASLTNARRSTLNAIDQQDWVKALEKARESCALCEELCGTPVHQWPKEWLQRGGKQQKKGGASASAAAAAAESTEEVEGEEADDDGDVDMVRQDLRCNNPSGVSSLSALPSVGIERLRYAKLLAYHNQLEAAVKEWTRA